MMKLITCLLGFSLVAGCSAANLANESIDAKRARLADEINAERIEYLNEMSQYYSDYRCYVDAKSNDVVIEFTYADGLTLDTPEVMATRRPAMVEQYTSDPDLRNLILEGIVIHFKYLAHDKTVVYESTISKKDLQGN